MTKTPGSAAPCPDVGDMIHSLHWPTEPAQHTEEQSRAVALRAAPPELVVTCDPCVAQTEQKINHRNTSGFSRGFHPDEESLCSDSGFGGSPASSLGLRKLSDCSSVGLSPTSSFEEYEEEFSGNNEGKAPATRNDAVSLLTTSACTDFWFISTIRRCISCHVRFLFRLFLLFCYCSAFSNFFSFYAPVLRIFFLICDV